MSQYKSHIPWLKRGKPVYVSIDSTPLFLILIAKYFKETNDKKFLLEIWPNIELALEWILKKIKENKNGFLAYQQNQSVGPINQSWKDSDEYSIKPPVAMVEVQGYAYLALSEMAKLAKLIKKINLADSLLTKAEFLKNNFNKIFWLEKEKFYAFALDGDNQQVKKITSNPGHLLFTGICDEGRDLAIVERLFKGDFWTQYGKYGIRNHKFGRAVLS